MCGRKLAGRASERCEWYVEQARASKRVRVGEEQAGARGASKGSKRVRVGEEQAGARGAGKGSKHVVRGAGKGVWR